MLARMWKKRTGPADGKAACGPDTAGLMLTNPNTLGLFDANILEITQKGDQLAFTLETLDFAAVSAVCAEPSFHNKVFFSAGSVPKLTWKLARGEDPLKAAQTFVGRYAASRGSAL